MRFGRTLEDVKQEKWRGAYFYKDGMTFEDRQAHRENIHYSNSPDRFYDLTENQQTEMINWIQANLISRKTINENCSSYGLKHVFSSEKKGKGYYVTNGQFKGAMIAAGFEPIEFDVLNHTYRISKKSPAFKGDY
jgi:hypothetical protein